MRLAYTVALGLVGLMLYADARPAAQAPFQFVVSATDASGKPAESLKPEDLTMTENGVRVPISKVEPYSVPLKVTVTVDNGSDIADMIGHIRTGLKGFFEALPEGVEVTLISTSPQPRTVVKPTTDRAQIQRGVNLFAPETDQRPRFTDALVEFGQRLKREERDLKSGKIKPYAPILVMVSTAANEQTSYEPSEIQSAVQTILGHRTRLFVVVTTTKVGDANQLQDINRNRQAMIAAPVTKATNGRFETLATSIRLQTLLPEWGAFLASLHTRQSAQYIVTAQRSLSGPLQNPNLDVKNLTGMVTMDGFLAQ